MRPHRGTNIYTEQTVLIYIEQTGIIYLILTHEKTIKCVLFNPHFTDEQTEGETN